MGILDKITSSEDIKELKDYKLVPLCKEIREFLIDNLSKTGGHLASNLGTVELNVALHRVYDSTEDRIVFDVGHQSYTHKIITGRKNQFPTLRQYGGLSGYPKPSESEDDAFIAGHASNAVSVAVGMAKARTMSGENYDVVALLGDGALTGGLAYEGLASAGASGEPMVIILNDNNMSIDPNVGGTARLLQKMRVRQGYISFKRWYKSAFTKLPKLYAFNHKVKEWIKWHVLPGNVFSSMGLYYLGPVDGHDVKELESVLRWARDRREPVLVHVLTKKGKGCVYAEERPECYHGVGPFDPVTGEMSPSKASFSEKFGEYLCEFAEKNDKICAITAAMASGTGLDIFAKQFPDRFIDTGIAEGHATAMSAGLAKQGMLPVFAVYSSFEQRGFDMLIHDVSLLNLHVVFGIDRAGIVGGDGETHNGVFDVSYLSSVPGLTLMCPSNFAELHDMMENALFEIDGPVAIRYPRGGEGRYTESRKEQESIIREGSDVTLACYGTMVNEMICAAEMLEKQGISAEIVKISAVKPENYPVCLKSVEKTGKLVVSEEVCAAGCVGERIITQAALSGKAIKNVKLLNLGEGIVAHGDRALLMREMGIDAQAAAEAASQLCGR